MPALKQPKREIFAQQLAHGKTQDEAYVIAGYKKSRANASKLARLPVVVSRVRQITANGAAKAAVSVQSICEELEKARIIAEEDRQPGSMVMASMGKAKVSRLLEDVVKHVGADGQAIKHSIEVRFVDIPETIEHDDDPG